MILDRRKFHAVAFYSESIKSISDAKNLINGYLVKEIAKLSGTDSYIEIEHVAYYSKIRYSLSPELDQIIVTLGGKEYFEYNLYFIGFNMLDKYITLVAAPFLLMLRHIFDSLKKSFKLNGMIYRVINLRDIISAIQNNRHLGGKIKLTRVDMMINADTSAYTISLRGPDVIHSNTFIKLRDSLHGTGISLSPRRCSILYNDHEGNRFTLMTDQFGNYSFRVAKDARNLSSSNNLFLYLVEESLMKETLALPLIRKTEIDEDESDEDS
jgi:hypothetical protein